MDSETLICITCPKGCSLSITREGDTVVEAKGGCARGFEYARREIADPRRMVASTVRIQGALHPLLPVYTSAPIPKPKIRPLLDELRGWNCRRPCAWARWSCRMRWAPGWMCLPAGIWDRCRVRSHILSGIQFCD